MNESSGISEILAGIREQKGPERAVGVARLFEVAKEDTTLRERIILDCLQLLQGELSGEEIAPHLSVIIEIWRSVFADVIKPFQEEGRRAGWTSDDEYEKARDFAGVVLDLMGYLHGQVVSDALGEALTLSDPRLKLFAVVSLLRRHEPVNSEQIEHVAAANETRIILWNQLRCLEMEYLMPERWADLEQLATSALLNWVADPRELGSPPEEIELMLRVPFEIEGESSEVYLFRFREYPKPWEPGQGWIAGIAGPFRKGAQIDSPWSSFDHWDSMSPEEHFNKLYYRARTCAID